MSLSDALPTFLAEARGLLEAMETALGVLDGNPNDTGAINSLFRAAHTIKGSAGLFGLDHIVDFTHEMESVLDRVRDGALSLNSSRIELMLLCRDHIDRLLEVVEIGSEPDEALLTQGEELTARLRQDLPASAASPSDPIHWAPVTGDDPVRNLGSDPTEGDTLWHLSLRFGRDVLRHGMDPLSFIHYLNTLGEVRQVYTVTDALPPAEEMDPESCYLGFEIRLHSEADKQCIEDVFDFVREESQIRILPPGAHFPQFLALMQAVPEDNHRLGEILVGCGAITERELEHMLDAQARQKSDASPTSAPRLGEALVQEERIQPELVGAALRRQQEVRRRQAQESRLLRVRADKLDSLIDLVGELVIAGAGLQAQVQGQGDTALHESAQEIARLVDGIRDGAMNLRLVEIGETFSRFGRVVRDVSRETGKDIALRIEGAETELDKTVVERLADPLTHLVRNAIDHGIESPEIRQARSKPSQGQLHLGARHEAGSVVIEIMDDGGGLDRERILAKAKERGLLPSDAEPDDAEVWNLIFEPGFSTAQSVSNLSGRGVGMDVVKQAIDALRGGIEIESSPGQGSTFRIRLPLSLAIIDGFRVSVSGNEYVVPLDMVLECMEMPRDLTEGETPHLNLRGDVLPLLPLGAFFGLPKASVTRRNIVVVQWGGRSAGLLVDELQGQLQAVIKPLGPLFKGLPGISGSTILGSGEVALVLDVPGLLERVVSVDSASYLQ
ncbi:chemotaxis protein CheA [Ectothiorhodospira marina]|uniref:Chemotaxis protein CheA n=1 Tax=Ectothiorhodospira marina TaxID=1396821 RepID=A0A1H7F8A4_9GAMM|nr:chemotaxis protein CheA [Ectothiorhodospira marina]SEK22371.1 two-component system, chemotaxis family, sensor kinase CheA [Ectothiorhodospira marina]